MRVFIVLTTVTSCSEGLDSFEKSLRQNLSHSVPCVIVSLATSVTFLNALIWTRLSSVKTWGRCTATDNQSYRTTCVRMYTLVCTYISPSLFNRGVRVEILEQKKKPHHNCIHSSATVGRRLSNIHGFCRPTAEGIRQRPSAVFGLLVESTKSKFIRHIFLKLKRWPVTETVSSA